VVLSVDEKSQIQALDRTQPGLPLKPGKCGTMTHDYKRNGTTTLFAALDVLDGTGRASDRVMAAMKERRGPQAFPLDQARRYHTRQTQYPELSVWVSALEPHM
jgi:hypothetical protein